MEVLLALHHNHDRLGAVVLVIASVAWVAYYVWHYRGYVNGRYDR
jgi:nitrogen regulatory protein PII-like uncharacterized protein